MKKIMEMSLVDRITLFNYIKENGFDLKPHWNRNNIKFLKQSIDLELIGMSGGSDKVKVGVVDRNKYT